MSGHHTINQKRLSLAVVSGITVELLNKVAPLLILHIAQERLGLAAFGFAMFGITFVELTLPFIVFGYQHLGSVALAKHRDNPQYISQLISNIVALRLIHGLLVGIAVAVWLAFYPPYAPYRVLVGALSFTFIFASIESVWVHLAIQKMTLVNLMNGCGRFMSLAAIYFLIESPEDATFFAVLNLLSTAAINLLSFISSCRLYPLVRPRWPAMVDIWRRSQSFALILFFMVFFERADILIVEHVLGVEGAGLYTGPARISHSLFQVASAIVMAFFSEMIIAPSKEALTHHLRLGMWALVTFMAPFVCGVWFVDEVVLDFVFGSAFREVAPLLGLLTASIFLSLAISALGLQILVVRGRARELVGALSFGAAAALLFAGLGVQVAGMPGVAIGMAAAKFITLILLVLRVRPYIERFPFADMGRALIPGLVMAAVLAMVSSPLFIVNLSVGGLIYMAVSGLVNRRELALLYQVWRQRRSAR